jgi:ribosomal protein L37AE/L43A
VTTQPTPRPEPRLRITDEPITHCEDCNAPGPAQRNAFGFRICQRCRKALHTPAKYYGGHLGLSKAGR